MAGILLKNTFIPVSWLIYDDWDCLDNFHNAGAELLHRDTKFLMRLRLVKSKEEGFYVLPESVNGESWFSQIVRHNTSVYLVHRNISFRSNFNTWDSQNATVCIRLRVN